MIEATIKIFIFLKRKNNNYNNCKLWNTIIILVDYVGGRFNDICTEFIIFYDIKQRRQI